VPRMGVPSLFLICAVAGNAEGQLPRMIADDNNSVSAQWPGLQADGRAQSEGVRED
jgi:hypothetical protein